MGYQGFPDTTWGFISRIEDAPGADYRAGLEVLCCRYWKPIYYYLRVACARTEEDAKDLTQAFLLWLLEGEALKKYVPERGSFRRFLKVLLTRYVGHEDRAARRIKRGGATRILPLEGADRPLEDVVMDRSAVSPERILDQQWVTMLMERAVERARRQFFSSGRETLYKVFDAHDLCRSPVPPTYCELAVRFGLKESQVRDYLYLARRAVREQIRAELALLTRDARELEDEWNELFRSDRLAETPAGSP